MTGRSVRAASARAGDDARAERSDAAQGAPAEPGASAGSAKPDSADARAARKTQVIGRGASSVVRSIADAIVAKDGEPFLICPPEGSIAADGEHGYGLYLHDCRFLSGYELRLAGAALEPLAASAAAGTHAELELTNPELAEPSGRTIAPGTLAIRWTREVDGVRSTLSDRISLRSYCDDDLLLPIELSFAARFDDVFVVRGLLGDHRGRLSDPAWEGDRLVFAYDGLDDVRRTLAIAASPDPARRRPDGMGFDIALGARAEATIAITLEMGEEVRPGGAPLERRSPGGQPPRTARSGQTETGTQLGDWVGGEGWTARARSDSYLLDAVLARSLEDLQLLRASLDGYTYYDAGIPWFATLFGRDSVIASLQTLAFDTSVARGTLRLLASRQGTHEDDWRDEQPGKVLHELRIGELARIGAIPHTPYYGTVDATPLFLVLLGRYVAWTGDLALFSELRPNVDQALEWLERWADPDGAGYVAYESDEGHGLVNQGWKDSWDAIVDGRGRLATPPIALAEVQGYAFRALLEVADLLVRAGEQDRADALRRQAAELRHRFERDFWSERLGTYVLARQRDGRPCDVVTSNAGQVLWSGIALPRHARRTAERLLRDDMHSGWGIRTMSSEAAAYNPIGYHVGTVWPHDNGLIAAGFRRYGLDDEARRVFSGILEAATDFPHFRLPECFAGHGRREFGIPVRYPIACHPQAWAAGSIVHLLESTLGLEPDAAAGCLRVVRPTLPDFVDQLELCGIRVGDGSADLRFRGEEDDVEVEILRTRGLEVQVEGRASARRKDRAREGRPARPRVSSGPSAERPDRAPQRPRRGTR